ncbi:hypothetical protein CH063_04368 [Colletotrichum higginsianum]|uniref:Uncharacterized protein n=1 Tax=Colletotrichum higginsianum (strain IMI 349063) TaxID=759273 RepID=H1UV65_COLHI|nr:hypothetical protein CH063_04368 [Colletotrichum higginsianum]
MAALHSKDIGELRRCAAVNARHCPASPAFSPPSRAYLAHSTWLWCSGWHSESGWLTLVWHFHSRPKHHGDNITTSDAESAVPIKQKTPNTKLKHRSPIPSTISEFGHYGCGKAAYSPTNLGHDQT